MFYSDLRLVVVEDIQHRDEALELAVFQNIVMKHIEMARETLMKKYGSSFISERVRGLLNFMSMTFRDHFK